MLVEPTGGRPLFLRADIALGRSLVGVLGAAIPAAAVAASPALAGTDPIFAAIEAHKQAWAAFRAALDVELAVEEQLADTGLYEVKGTIVGYCSKVKCTEFGGGILADGGGIRFDPTDEKEPIIVYNHEDFDKHFDRLCCSPGNSERVASERARCHAELSARRAAKEAAEEEVGWADIVGRREAAQDASWEAWGALLDTPQPSTLAGLLALVKYATSHEDGDSDEGRTDILAAVQASLEKFVG